MKLWTDNELTKLYGVHRSELLRFLVARTGSRIEAEDLLQELWLKASEAAAAPASNPRSYLFRMAQNLLIDRLRERQRRTHREQLWFDGQGSAGAASQEELAALEAAITALPARARQVLRLHKLEGLTHAEVAAALGITRSAVEKHLASATARLRRALTDCGS